MISLGLLAATWTTYVIWGVVIVALVGLLFWSSRSNKKRNAEAAKLIDAVKPGNKVKTIGGICGVVTAIDWEENTFVLETGDGEHKSYIKFDRKAIYQTDAKVEAQAPVNQVSQPKAEEKVNEEAPKAEKAEESKEKTDAEAVELKAEAKTEAVDAKDEKKSDFDF